MGLISEEPREITLPDLRLVGSLSLVDLRQDNNNSAFGRVWERFFPHLESLEAARTQPGRLFGLNLFPPGFRADKQLFYGACAEVDSLDREYSSEYVSRFVPCATYYSFEVQGTTAEIAPAYDRAWELYTVLQGGDPACSVSLELYDDRFVGPDSSESRMDLLFVKPQN